MRVALIGASGFIGPYIVGALIAHKIRVRCLVRNPERLKRQIGPLAAYIEIRQFDLLHPDSEVFDCCDVVIHNAGATKALSMKDFRRINVDGTRAVAAAVLAATGVGRFVLVSSLAAAVSSTTPIDEEAEPNPISDYGKSKHEAELVVKQLLGGRLDYTIVRPAAVYGIGDEEFMPLFKLIKAGIKPKFSWGDNPISLVHVTDVSGAIVHLALAAETANQTYFVAHPEVVSVNRLIDTVAEMFEITPVEFPVSDFALRVGVKFISTLAWLSRKPTLLSPSKLEELRLPWTCDVSKLLATGFTPTVDLESGIKGL
jgi:nucleoside-diphosphate-sugar epimerase